MVIFFLRCPDVITLYFLIFWLIGFEVDDESKILQLSKQDLRAYGKTKRLPKNTKNHGVNRTAHLIFLNMVSLDQYIKYGYVS